MPEETEHGGRHVDGGLHQRIADTSGATAVATFIYGKDVYVCWAGDSEAALFSRDGSERHLCVVHKASLDVRPCPWAVRFVSAL